VPVAMPGWREDIVVTDWQSDAAGKWFCTPGARAGEEERCSQVYHGVVLGLSGGIDSALSAAVAVDALGADRVRCVMLPSRYTSQDSLEDADECAKLLGVKYESVPIEGAVEAINGALKETFA